MGQPRGDLGEGFRSFAARGYVIVFRYETGALRVLTIAEGHRDFPGLDPH